MSNNYHTLKNQNIALMNNCLEFEKRSKQNGDIDHLKRKIKYLEEENKERNEAMKAADEEREEAVKYAQQLKDEIQELATKYKTDMEAYEQEFSHMKEKHDRLLDYVRVSG